MVLSKEDIVKAYELKSLLTDNKMIYMEDLPEYAEFIASMIPESLRDDSNDSILSKAVKYITNDYVTVENIKDNFVNYFEIMSKDKLIFLCKYLNKYLMCHDIYLKIEIGTDNINIFMKTKYDSEYSRKDCWGYNKNEIFDGICRYLDSESTSIKDIKYSLNKSEIDELNLNSNLKIVGAPKEKMLTDLLGSQYISDLDRNNINLLDYEIYKKCEK